ncbi:MAG: hypothetical protein KIS76_15740 [Pyrinomonadaceae bacterium]|nr:hypothetical protein [Pyrinomonadaceae bacterium]
MKKIYATAWILLTALFLTSVVTGFLDPLGLFAFSLSALALVYALAFWSVIVNTRYAQTDNLQKIRS